MGHENAEGMAHVGVRVEPTVRLGSEGTVLRILLNIYYSSGENIFEQRFHLNPSEGWREQ